MMKPYKTELNVNVMKKINYDDVFKSPPCLAAKEKYHIKDSLQYHGWDFVENAYKALLERPPYSDGGRAYLFHLLTGRMTRWKYFGHFDFLKKAVKKSEGRWFFHILLSSHVIEFL